MAILRNLSIPLLVVTCMVGFIWWAFPEGLSTARTLGVVLGWAGCSLLLVSLLLMLRETWLAQWLGGLERMYQWHHWSGMTAYVLLLAHPLVLAADVWPSSRLLAWQMLSPFSQGWPIWAGWLSLLFLMLGLAATFKSRIPYQIWRRLHFGMGVGVLLGIVHLFLLGISEPVLPIMGLAAFFLGWRLIRDDFGLAARPYVVGSVKSVAEGMVEISLKPMAAPAAITPGQFVLVAFLGPMFRGREEFHPFTVSSIGINHEIGIVVKALGDCTRHIQSVEPGAMVRVHGAFGTFLADRPPTPQLWVAGGIGIMPFLALLRTGPVNQQTTLLYLYRAEVDTAFLQELQVIAKGDQLLSLKALATGAIAPDLNFLLPDIQGLANYECYLCGPRGMVAALRKDLHNLGVRPHQIHFEKFEFR